MGVCLEPFPGVVDRGLKQLLQWKGTEKLVGAAHSGRNTGHAYRSVTDGVGSVFDLVYSVARYCLADDTEHVGGCGFGSAMSVVDGDATPSAVMWTII